MAPMLFLVLAASLTQMSFSWFISYNRAEETSLISIALLPSILSWYTTKDLVEDSDKSLETCDLEAEILPLTSSKLSGEGSENKLFIPMQFVKNTVGNWKSC